MSKGIMYIKGFKSKGNRFKKGPNYIIDNGASFWKEKYSFFSYFKLIDSNRVGGPCHIWPDGTKLNNKSKLKQEAL